MNRSGSTERRLTQQGEIVIHKRWKSNVLGGVQLMGNSFLRFAHIAKIRVRIHFALPQRNNSLTSRDEKYFKNNCSLTPFCFRASGARTSVAGARPLRARVRRRPTNLAVPSRFHRDPLSEQTLSRNVIHLQTDAISILDRAGGLVQPDGSPGVATRSARTPLLPNGPAVAAGVKPLVSR